MGAPEPTEPWPPATVIRRQPAALPSPRVAHGFPHDLTLVKVQLLRADDLVGLMAFTGEEQRVRRSSLMQSGVNRREAIGYPEVRSAIHPSLDVVDNGIRVFGAGIVRRDDGQIGQLYGNPSHQGPL